MKTVSKGIISVLAIGVIALAIFAVPIVEVTYYQEEPYTATETYYEKEPYTTLVNIDYRVTEARTYNWFWTTGSDCWVTIKNADIKSGYFFVTFDLVTRGGARITRTAREYITIAEEKRVTVKHSGDYISRFTYSIDPPQKEVTMYRDVQKTREVVRIREVESTKRVPVFEYLTEWSELSG